MNVDSHRVFTCNRMSRHAIMSVTVIGVLMEARDVHAPMFNGCWRC